MTDSCDIMDCIVTEYLSMEILGQRQGSVLHSRDLPTWGLNTVLFNRMTLQFLNRHICSSAAGARQTNNNEAEIRKIAIKKVRQAEIKITTLRNPKLRIKNSRREDTETQNPMGKSTKVTKKLTDPPCFTALSKHSSCFPCSDYRRES